MHNYSMDRPPKENILFGLAFLTIMATPYINNIFKELESHLGGLTLPLSGISVFLVFSFIFWVFDKYFWKCKLVRKILLLPDLNGAWICEGKTEMKNGKKGNYQWQGEVNITQSWSKIIIRLKTDNSVSLSTVASIRRIESSGYRVLYLYESDPKSVQDGLNKHEGAAEITFTFDCTQAEGNYYTDEHRNTVGVIKLRRKNEL